MVRLAVVKWYPWQPKYKVSPSRYQRRMMYKRLGAKYFGRRRNCYTITIKITQRAHRYSTQHRVLRVKKMQRLWETRITAACLEHNMDKDYFLVALAEEYLRVSNILDQDQARSFVGPDLVPTCLQRLSADDISRQRVNIDSHIALNRQTLADLAIYEPRTFQSLVQYVKMRSLEIGLQSATLGSPHGLITRGMLK